MRTLLIALLAGTSGCIVTVSNSCLDGVLDGTESDVDCGGAVCALCGEGRHCVVNADCSGGTCAVVGGQRICQVAPPGPTCTDGIKNGVETDVDCGGNVCSPCAIN